MKLLFSIYQIILLLFNISLDTNNEISYHNQLIGSWVIYAGGVLAPELLVFSNDGSGNAYSFIDDYEETWLTDAAFDPSIIDDKMKYSWHVEPQSDHSDLFNLTITYENGTNQVYQARIENSFEGTDYLGLTLFAYNSGTSWIKIRIDKTLP